MSPPSQGEQVIPRIPRQVIVFTMPAGVSLRPGVPVLPVLLPHPADHCRHSQCRCSKFHGLGCVFRPRYLFLVDHDPLNEQPQQLWRQLRDIRVPLCFIKEAVRPVHGFPQALALSLSVEYRWRFPPHTGVLPLRRARDVSRCERRLHGARLCQKVISGSVNSPNPIFYALHGKKYFRMRGIVF